MVEGRKKVLLSTFNILLFLLFLLSGNRRSLFIIISTHQYKAAVHRTKNLFCNFPLTSVSSVTINFIFSGGRFRFGLVITMTRETILFLLTLLLISVSCETLARKFWLHGLSPPRLFLMLNSHRTNHIRQSNCDLWV